MILNLELPNISSCDTFIISNWVEHDMSLTNQGIKIWYEMLLFLLFVFYSSLRTQHLTDVKITWHVVEPNPSKTERVTYFAVSDNESSSVTGPL